MGQREDILLLLSRHHAEWEQLGVRSLALFGSAARDALQCDSDVDILVEFATPVTFDRYMELKFALERVLGRPVDLVTSRALRPRLRARVEKELIRVP